MADAVGLFKEIDDLRGGTGCSFVYLAADRAGRHFGEVPVESNAMAVRLQYVMVNKPGEDEFMPSINGFLQQMQGSEFRAVYVSVDSPLYQHVV